MGMQQQKPFAAHAHAKWKKLKPMTRKKQANIKKKKKKLLCEKVSQTPN